MAENRDKQIRAAARETVLGPEMSGPVEETEAPVDVRDEQIRAAARQQMQVSAPQESAIGPSPYPTLYNQHPFLGRAAQAAMNLSKPIFDVARTGANLLAPGEPETDPRRTVDYMMSGDYAGAKEDIGVPPGGAYDAVTGFVGEAWPYVIPGQASAKIASLPIRLAADAAGGAGIDLARGYGPGQASIGAAASVGMGAGLPYVGRAVGALGRGGAAAAAPYVMGAGMTVDKIAPYVVKYGEPLIEGFVKSVKTEINPQVLKLADESGFLNMVDMMSKTGQAAGKAYNVAVTPFAWTKENLADPYTKWTHDHWVVPFEKMLRDPTKLPMLNGLRKVLLTNWGLTDPELAARGLNEGFMTVLYDRNRKVAGAQRFSLQRFDDIMDKVSPEFRDDYMKALEGDAAAFGRLTPELKSMKDVDRATLDKITTDLVGEGVLDADIAGKGMGNYVTRVGAYKKFIKPEQVEKRMMKQLGPEGSELMTNAFNYGVVDYIDAFSKDYAKSPNMAMSMWADKLDPQKAATLKAIMDYGEGFGDIITEYSKTMEIIKNSGGGVAANFDADLRQFMKARGIKRTVDKKLVAEMKEEGWEQIGEKGGKVVMRMDYPLSVREMIFGEIRNPAWRVANHIEKLRTKLADWQYMKDVDEGWGQDISDLKTASKDIENKKVAIENLRANRKLPTPESTANIKLLEDELAQMERELPFIEEFNRTQKIDGVKYTKLTGDKYGSLDGKYVPEEIGQFLKNRAGEGYWDNFGGKTYQKYLTMWKKGKTVWSPSTHMRNIYFNFVLADFEDVAVGDYLEAIADSALAKKGGKTKYIDALKNTGVDIFGPGFTQAELDMVDGLTDGLKGSGIAQGLSDFDPKTGFMAAMSAADKWSGKAYAGSEKFFKLSVAIAKMREGKTAREAALIAQQTMFDYGATSPYVQAMRKTGLSPFITFNAKLIPRYAEIAATKPWKMAKWYLYQKGVQEYSKGQLGITDEDYSEINKGMGFGQNPDWRVGGVMPTTSLLMPRTVDVELKDGSTREELLTLDMNYIMAQEQFDDMLYSVLPLVGTLLNLGNEEGEQYRRSMHPAISWLTDVASNRQFGGKEIYPPLEIQPTMGQIWLGSNQYPGIARHAWRTFMPKMIAYDIPKVIAAMRGDTDWQQRKRGLPATIADVGAGVKTNTYTPQQAETSTGIGGSRAHGSLYDEHMKIEKLLARGSITPEEAAQYHANLERINRPRVEEKYPLPQEQQQGGSLLQ